MGTSHTSVWPSADNAEQRQHRGEQQKTSSGAKLGINWAQAKFRSVLTFRWATKREKTPAGWSRTARSSCFLALTNINRWFTATCWCGGTEIRLHIERRFWISLLPPASENARWIHSMDHSLLPSFSVMIGDLFNQCVYSRDSALMFSCESCKNNFFPSLFPFSFCIIKLWISKPWHRRSFVAFSLLQ